jgi:hypothetical protein
VKYLGDTNAQSETRPLLRSDFGYCGSQNRRELAFDEIFKSPAQFVKTIDPDSVCPDAFQVIGHAVDRIDVSLSCAFRGVANLRGRLEGSV